MTKEIIENDLFESPSIYDKNVCLNKPNLEFQPNLYDAIKNADAVVLLTEWEVYKNIDWEFVSQNVRKPFWIFDTRSLLKDKNIHNLGLNIWQLGNGSLN